MKAVLWHNKNKFSVEEKSDEKSMDFGVNGVVAGWLIRLV